MSCWHHVIGRWSENWTVIGKSIRVRICLAWFKCVLESSQESEMRHFETEQLVYITATTVSRVREESEDLIIAICGEVKQ